MAAADHATGDPHFDVSVVIPAYNRPALLGEAIESILAQTRPAREIIVVDNGPDGLAGDVAQRFGKRVTYIRQAPMGVQVARNTGARAATSRWIALLDDDDMFRPSFLATAAEVMADRRIDLICTNLQKFRPVGPLRVTLFENAPPGFWDGVPGWSDGGRWFRAGRFPVEKVLDYIPFYPSGMIVRRDLFDRLGGYDPAVPSLRAEDVEFLVRALAIADVGVIRTPEVDYRLHPDNASGDFDEQRLAKWTVLEYVRAKNAHGSASFGAALERDIVARRGKMFDVAFASGDYGTLAQIGGMLRPNDWSRGRRLKSAIARLPKPLPAMLTGAKRLVAPR